MKFTLGWLKDHLDTEAPLTHITDRLTAIGLELENIEDRAALYKDFKVAFVEKADRHPDADRLKVCLVDTGAEKLQVVCGAPNAQAGMKAIFAPVGSYIPGTDITLKKGMIRGQESNGMLVSEREMGLSENHEGIIDLTASDPALGTGFAALYGIDDPVIEINLTPNRADCTGVRGIARDLAAAGQGTLKNLDTTPVKDSFPSPVNISLQFEEGSKAACPFFIGCLIKNVRNGHSPVWLQNRLKAIGLRPISALVDITNYISFDLGRPLHVFDADTLRGNLHVRLAKKGETLEALNEKIYELDEDMTVVCDDSGVIGLGGVMGGISTACTEKTVNVFLEVAYFDPARTAKTGRALQITSDARYRFERGIDPAFLEDATSIATRLILDLCGGQASETVRAGEIPDWKRAIAFDPAYTKKLAGIDIEEKEQKNILQKLGFEISGSNVQPPSWRGDIEGRADLVEEIIRIHGFDHIRPVTLEKQTAITTSAETPSFTKTRKSRATLAGRGMNECVTWSFMGRVLADKFSISHVENSTALQIINPINAELDRMRPSLLPNLIEATGRNRDRGFSNNALFEVGPVFLTARPDGQLLMAAGIRSGFQGTRHWSGTEAHRAVDIFDAKADALAALESCGTPVKNLQTSHDAPDWYHPGHSGVLRLGANILAYFGEIHPAILEFMTIREKVCGFEIFLDRIPAARKKAGSAKPLPNFSSLQPVERDFAFILDDTIEADTLVRTAMGVDKNLVQQVEIFDIYKGDTVGTGKKSVAMSVLLQPKDKTLTDAELEDITSKIIESITEKTGGTLRN
ncbi:MAG: phenylalanine--tRNA ligase subunit beta [Alphaproteobacteria bacterium CG_4_9_14_3_um_filter_47_13]|nr:MAG: phenylalanine--tRNA ligase subunit beta [Alphaproteobacteria bacterium CG_4_9_14_3_um_filter_47_13]